MLFGADPAQAIDGVSAEFGSGNGIWLWRLGAQWNGPERWTFRAGEWHGRGIGPHMVSNLAITNHRTFATHLQFGDHIGAGVRFGHEERYDIGVRLQHISNAGIENPNPGINFFQLRLQYHYR